MLSVVDASGAAFSQQRSARMPVFIQPAQQSMPQASRPTMRLPVRFVQAFGGVALGAPQAQSALIHHPVDTGFPLQPTVRVPAPAAFLPVEVPMCAPLARQPAAAVPRGPAASFPSALSAAVPEKKRAIAVAVKSSPCPRCRKDLSVLAPARAALSSFGRHRSPRPAVTGRQSPARAAQSFIRPSPEGKVLPERHSPSFG